MAESPNSISSTQTTPAKQENTMKNSSSFDELMAKKNRETQLTLVESQIENLKAMRRGEPNRFMKQAREPLSPQTQDQLEQQQQQEFPTSTNLTKLDKSPEQTPGQRRLQMQLLGRSMEGKQGEQLSLDSSSQLDLRSSTASTVRKEPELNNRLVNLSFCLILFLNLVINIDHGVMPAGAIAIKEYLGVSNTEYGLLGSIVFAGLVLGSVAASFVYNTINTKVVLAVVMALNAVSQVGFTMTKEYYYLIMSRFLTGFFQVFISIYWPVWVDAFAKTEKRKATWMSTFLASSPVGVLFGYVLTTQLIINYTWKYAFYVQAAAVAPAIMLILVIPNRYLTLKLSNSSGDLGGEVEEDDIRQLDSQSGISSQEPQLSLRQQMRSNPNRDMLGQSYDTDQLDELFESENDFQANGNTLNNLAMTTTTPQIEQLQNFENESTFRRIVELMKNGQFVLLTLSISSLYFVVTGLQYWVSAYLMITLQIAQEEVYYYYAFTCLSAPISGVIIGGIVFNCIGGFKSANAYALSCLLGFFACISCLPIPFCDNKYLVYLLLWAVFFFGATIIAPLVSFMLGSVQAERRTTANSIATLCYNLFGYLPAPFIYGLFSDIFPSDERRSHKVAIAVILYWSILAMVMMMFAMILFLKKQAREHNKTLRELFIRSVQMREDTKDSEGRRSTLTDTVESIIHPQGDTGAAGGLDADFDHHELSVQRRQDMAAFQRKSMQVAKVQKGSFNQQRLNHSFVSAQAAQHAHTVNEQDDGNYLDFVDHSLNREEVKRDYFEGP